MLELFSSQSEGGKQFEYNLEHYLICCGRRRNACIYIDTPKKEFDGLEQVDECVMVGISSPGSLVQFGVRTAIIRFLKKGTRAYGK
jgi:hypothetical protein